MVDFTKAWNIKEKDFPRDGSAAEKLAFCVRYALLAPSTYNTQPWYFSIKDNIVGLYADRRYALPVIDPNDRELALSCACALFNLRLSIRALGYSETTELLPDQNDPDLLARVKIDTEKAAIDKDRELFTTITRRHMNRGAFEDKDIPEDALNELKSAAAAEGGWLHVCKPHERGVIISLIAEGDHIQSGKKTFRRELAAWVDARREKSGDGLPNYAASFTEIMGSLSPQVVRRFEDGNHQAVRDEELEDGAPVIAILGSKSGGMIEALHTGQGMMRMLLTAEKLGLSVCPMNQPCEVPELRLRLHDEIDHAGRAQMIFRIGYGGKVSITPRRSIESFIEFEGRQPSSFKPANQGTNNKKFWLPNFLAKRA